MTIKIKMRDEKKAIVRFNNKDDADYFIHVMINARDILGVHPKVSIQDINSNEIKRTKS
jgi:hypothetical protein